MEKRGSRSGTNKNNKSKHGRDVKQNTNNKEKPPEKNQFNGVRMEIVSLLVFMLAVFVYICVSHSEGITEETVFIGFVGTWIFKGLSYIFGQAALMVAFFLLAWSIHIGVLKKYWSQRMWGVSILALAILIDISIYYIPGGLNPLEAGSKGLGAGYVGGAAGYVILNLVGSIGAAILIFIGFLVSISLILNQPLVHLFKSLLNAAKKAGKYLNTVAYTDENEPEAVPVPAKAPVIIETAPERQFDLETNLPPAMEPLLPDNPEIKEKPRENKASIKLVRSANDAAPVYVKPSLDLLNNFSSERIIDKKNIKESVSVLEDTFASFGIKVKVNQVSCGPAVTRYELSPAPGVKISRILSLTDDLQLNLATAGIRIEAPIPGKSAIGIEVPNSKILSVGLRNLLSSPAFIRMASPLSFALGEDITGNPVVARLSDMPHLLIAGSTGSGKSVCLNCIIMSFLYNTSPEELRLVFIDPKMVELAVYNGIPHLLTPVVTDVKKASVVLRWMVNEMEKRYRLFADKGVRDIQRYNQVSREKLPFIVIIIDELADLMMISPVEVEDSICRLAQMARAAGMHLIVATQRPSVDVVTGIIKANIPSRIAFAVSSQADSRTILDNAGAEKLLGKGDMLFFPVGAVKPFRVQGAYVSDQDIEQTVEYIKTQNSDNDNEAEMQEIEFSLAQAEDDEGDELFWQAVDLFVDSGKASVSMLQRRLRIGYARAARLVDLMEERGIVSELDNNKKREVLIDRSQLEKIQSRNLVL
ncbi:FtsK/SpoIIIE family DNA translocase [Syntrophomonas palmitatica]|uniref:FtsK/SpoIIIE family DNA translocase n=1 Tax=Syntrophomonas palmitatica TaxID=402877 RepID=UPI0009F9400F|nr:DNA translocase FtsK [Syntrophomonas palmitatica]